MSDGTGSSSGRRQSLTRYINKVKTILSPKSRQPSISDSSVLAGPSSEVESLTGPSTSIILSTPVTESSTLAPEPAPTVPSNATITPISQSASNSRKEPNQVEKNAGTHQRPGRPVSENIRAAQQKSPLDPMARSLVQQERARVLFAKYGMTLEPHEWTFPTTTPVARVEKQIRVRIRRICHLCSTIFGANRTCSNTECGHLRCPRCLRLPPKNSRRSGVNEKSALMTRGSEALLINRRPLATIEEQHLPSARIQLKMPSRTGGQNLVYKPIKQRIRRTCDCCHTDFQKDSRICAICGHQRCVACPRSPAKWKKYPNGYPGDTFARSEDSEIKTVERTVKKTTRRVKWTCHVCKVFYIEGGKTCRSCQHERCLKCTRKPLKKIKVAPDPDIVKSVAEKLAKMRVAEGSSGV